MTWFDVTCVSGILKCVNFDAEIGLLTGKDFRFRSIPVIWSALFGSDFFCPLNISRNQEIPDYTRDGIQAKIKDYD